MNNKITINKLILPKLEKMTAMITVIREMFLNFPESQRIYDMATESEYFLDKLITELKNISYK